MRRFSGIVSFRYPHALVILAQSTHQSSPFLFTLPLPCQELHLPSTSLPAIMCSKQAMRHNRSFASYTTSCFPLLLFCSSKILGGTSNDRAGKRNFLQTSY